MCLSACAFLAHSFFFFFFFNETATPEIYPLSLHDALPICHIPGGSEQFRTALRAATTVRAELDARSDRKSTRLNSSHLYTSYAVFCLKKNHIAPALRALNPLQPTTHTSPPQRNSR